MTKLDKARIYHYDLFSTFAHRTWWIDDFEVYSFFREIERILYKILNVKCRYYPVVRGKGLILTWCDRYDL